MIRIQESCVGVSPALSSTSLTLSSWSAVVTAKEQGVDLLSQSVVQELETAWGGSKLVRSVIAKAFMLAGKVKLHEKPMTQRLAAMYLTARPGYPRKWFSKLAALSPHHYLAWDIGTGNVQATIGVAEPYKQVNAGDISEEQLKYAVPHAHVQYLLTPSSNTLPFPFESVDVGCEDFGSFSPVNTASYEANCGFIVRGEEISTLYPSRSKTLTVYKRM
ncbi:Methyltransferase type [Salix suchowensis]|nr:Methyltransferase type [Salix suchowensis]